MTERKSGKGTDKVDGRTLRRGKRGRYHRSQIEGNDRLLRYVQLLMAIMEHLEVPVYRHRKSNHVYSYRAKIVILVLREKLKLSYEQFCIDAPSYPHLLSEMGVSFVPHRTTLIRFASIVDEQDLHNVIAAFRHFCHNERVLAIDGFCHNERVLAIDGTGFSNFLRSAHFAKRCKEFGIKTEPRSFTKLSVAVDTETHLVVSARASPNKKHDSRFVPEHVRDLTGMRISHIAMDKGYDGEPLHRYVRRNLGCVTVIPCRESRGNRGYSTHGVIRNQMKKALKEDGELKKVYGQRSQVETGNFMIKTHTGSHILSRLEQSKVTQALCKVIAHNCKIVADKDWSWNPAL